MSGVLPVVGAAALWAAGYLVRKLILKDVSALELTGITSVLATMFIGIQFRIKIGVAWSSFMRHPLHYLALAISGVVVGTTLMYLGLQRIELSVATLLERLQPIFTIAIAAVFLKERITPRMLGWGLVAMCASYGVVVGSLRGFSLNADEIIGCLAIIGAAFAWAVAAVVGKSALKLEESPEIISFVRFALGAIIICPLSIWSSIFHPVKWDLSITMGVVGSAYFSTVLGYVLYYKGLRYISASMSGFLELTTPVVAACLGWIVLGERVSSVQIVSGAVLLLSILIISLPAAESAHLSPSS